MFIKLIEVSFIFLLIFIFFPPLAFAINLSISNPQIINDEVTVQVDITGLSIKNYLQGMFTQPSVNPSYFGYTQNNNGDWYKYGGSYTKEEIQSTFFSFVPHDASWSGQLKIRNDPADPDYKGPREYILRVKRYTGNSDSEAQVSNDLAINLSYVLPTSSPTLEPSTTPAPTPTPISTSTPVKTPTLVSKTSVSNPKPTDSNPQVLAAREELKPSSTPIVSAEKVESTKKFPVVAGVLIVAGVVFVSLATLPFIRMRLKGYNEKHGSGRGGEEIS